MTLEHSKYNNYPMTKDKNTRPPHKYQKSNEDLEREKLEVEVKLQKKALTLYPYKEVLQMISVLGIGISALAALLAAISAYQNTVDNKAAIESINETQLKIDQKQKELDKRQSILTARNKRLDLREKLNDENARIYKAKGEAIPLDDLEVWKAYAKCLCDSTQNEFDSLNTIDFLGMKRLIEPHRKVCSDSAYAIIRQNSNPAK